LFPANYTLRDWRGPQRCYWRFTSSGMWSRVDR